jgi:hypothetical protein
VVNTTPRPLYPQERPGTHCIGGWVVLRVGLDGCGKSRPQRDSIPGPSSPYRLSYPVPHEMVVSGQIQDPGRLKLPVETARRAGGHRRRCGRFGEEGILLSLPLMEPRTARLIAWPLNRLRHPINKCGCCSTCL